MQVTFTKGNGGRTCGWSALRPPRTRIPGPTMAAGADLPHDLATFVIEAALGIRHGFWGCLADGATFASTGSRRTPQGRRVIVDHRDEIELAETRVNDLHFGWRRGEPVPVPVARELDEALTRWRALEDGEAMVLQWPLPARRGHRAASRAGRRR